MSNRRMDKAETEAIRDVLAGDRDAYRVLMDRHFCAVTRVAFRITGNEADAEEAAQEAFLRAYNKLPSFRQDSAFSTWIMRIAMNTAINLVERRKRDLSYHAPRIADEPSTAEHTVPVADRQAGPEVSSAESRGCQSAPGSDGGTDTDGTDGIHAATHGGRSYGGDRGCAEHYEQLGQAGGLSRCQQASPIAHPDCRRSSMKHFSEEELIAYQLHESSERSRHLQASGELFGVCRCLGVDSGDAACVFRRSCSAARPGAQLATASRQPRRTDAANISRGFELLRWHWAWPAVGLATAALILLAVFGLRVHRTGETRHNVAVNGHGPLTTEPTDPAIANHLDAAERLLTEVNNSVRPAGRHHPRAGT